MPQIWILLGKICSSPEIRKNIHTHGHFLGSVVTSLEKKQISNALFLLNLLSLEQSSVEVLLEREVDLYLFNLVQVFFKKDDEIIRQKRILWNLLLNLSCHSGFALSFLKFAGNDAVIQYLFRT